MQALHQLQNRQAYKPTELQGRFGEATAARAAPGKAQPPTQARINAAPPAPGLVLDLSGLNMATPSNCLLAAIAAWVAHPLTTRIGFMRNKARRWHCYWIRGGKRYEFYAAGRSSKTYLQNLIYIGEVREIGSA